MGKRRVWFGEGFCPEHNQRRKRGSNNSGTLVKEKEVQRMVKSRDWGGGAVLGAEGISKSREK